MKKVFFLIFFSCIATYAQQNINEYKYIIVPKQFNFFNKADKYKTSSLTKFLFTKNGFTTLFDNDQYPEALVKNRCMALRADVKEGSGMFTTKIKIALIDCNNKTIYTSYEGKSKNKDYKKAYHEAIRGAFKSIESLKYRYKEPIKEQVMPTSLPKNKVTNTPIERVNKRQVSSKRASVFRKVTKIGSNNELRNTNNRKPLLYAKRINNGFDLINVKDQIAFTLLDTNLREVFVIKNKNGILYKENNNWIADYYNINGDKVVKEYDIRVAIPSTRK